MSFFKKKKATAAAEPVAPLTNDPQMLFARLLFMEEPQFHDALLKEELSKQFDRFHGGNNESQNKHRQYFFPNYTVEYQEGSLPAQCTIFKPDAPDYVKTDLEKAYQQSWHWSEAREETQHFSQELIVNDLMALPLDYQDRVELFQKFLYAAALSLKPAAIYFPSSEKLVKTSDYLAQLQEQGWHTLYSLLNVRLFNINEGGMLMDTVGLHAIGLPDLQIRFEAHDPSQIAGLLYAYGQYLFENGSVILNGNTVEGLEEGSRWKCLYSNALLDPARSVLDIKE